MTLVPMAYYMGVLIKSQVVPVTWLLALTVINEQFIIT